MIGGVNIHITSSSIISRDKNYFLEGHYVLRVNYPKCNYAITVTFLASR